MVDVGFSCASVPKEYNDGYIINALHTNRFSSCRMRGYFDGAWWVR